jgi:hypothetical protein
VRRSARWVLSILLLALVAGTSAAKGPTTGAVDGTVLDDQDRSPLPGVRIEARSAALQGIRVTTTDAAGRFHVPALPPGIYEVRAMLSGFAIAESDRIRVALAETAVVALTMRIALSAEVEVDARTPLLDVSSATGGQNVREDVIRTLPVGRNYADILRISPGVGTDNAETQGRGLPFSIYGATSLENQWLVDGANTTNVIKGSQGKALPNEFVEEVQIKTSGYEAEYGRATGGIVNVLTKSGGNELHGDVFGYFGAKGLTAANKARPETDEFFVDRTQEDRRDYGVDLGGPFLKDRLWFFAAFNRVDLSQDQHLIADSYIPAAGMHFPISYSDNLHSGKLTARVSDSTTLAATVFADPERREGDVRNYASAQATTRQGIRDIGGTDATASAIGLFGARGTVEARYAHHRDAYSLTGDSNDVQVIDLRDPNGFVITGGIGGVTGFFDNNTSTRDAWKADGTVYAGDHEIKAGVDREHDASESTTYYSGGQRVTIDNCPISGPMLCPAGRTFYYQHDFLSGDASDPVGAWQPGGNRKKPTTNRLSLFVQDSFKAAPGLTINAGLRFDQDDVRDDSGRTIMKLSNEWQPRIGIAWDVLHDGRSRISASYGRFYYALPTDLAVAAYGHEIFVSTYNFSETSLAQDPSAPQATHVFGGAYEEPIQPGIKAMYQDEMTLAFERAFDPTFTVAVRYTYRELGRALDDRCDLDPGYPEARGNKCVVINPGSSDPYATGQGIHGCDGRDELGTDGNPAASACTSPSLSELPPVPAASRLYHGVELVAKKQIKGRLFLQASYVYSRLRGNYDGVSSNSQGTTVTAGTRVAVSQPGFGYDFDYPFVEQNSYGNLYLDRPHAFRLDTAYTAPFGLGVGLQAFLRSGAPISKQVVEGSYGVFVTPRGSEGRQAWDYEVNLQVQYAFRVDVLTLTLFAQGFDLLNRQTILDSESFATTAPPIYADYVNPDYGKSTGRRDPRSFRLGARATF